LWGSKAKCSGGKKVHFRGKTRQLKRAEERQYTRDKEANSMGCSQGKQIKTINIWVKKKKMVRLEGSDEGELNLSQVLGKKQKN